MFSIGSKFEIRHEICMLWKCNPAHTLSAHVVSEGVMMHCMAEQYVSGDPWPARKQSIISVDFQGVLLRQLLFAYCGNKGSISLKRKELVHDYQQVKEKQDGREWHLFCLHFRWAERICCGCIFRENWSFAFFSGNICCIFRNNLV